MKKTVFFGIVAAVVSLSACGRQSPTQPTVRANGAKSAHESIPLERDGTCRSGWLVAGDKCVPEDGT
jgi:hypothetical protein